MKTSTCRVKLQQVAQLLFVLLVGVSLLFIQPAFAQDGPTLNVKRGQPCDAVESNAPAQRGKFSFRGEKVLTGPHKGERIVTCIDNDKIEIGGPIRDITYCINHMPGMSRRTGVLNTGTPKRCNT